MSKGLLLDNSAWSRLGSSRLPRDRADEIAKDLELGHVYASLPLLLEAGYSARSAGDHVTIHEHLLALPPAPLEPGVEARAVQAQRELARTGHHRLSPIDLMMAALADHHGLGILHYDRDYDLIGERTDLEFGSVWLAEPGSL